ncbi:hypothetical protein L7F22_060051 [Adiantum nelumboides]|nr:hypothetical protein [Adiantum nelumboides]
MSSATQAPAAAALSSRDSAFSMPPDHSSAVWERQALGRDKFDRDRYTSTRRDWSADSRSSSYRSSGVLGSGSLTASFNRRRAIGRHEAVENGRYRSAVGRSESSTSLRSPTQIGKAERDICSPGYGSSPNIDRPSKSSDGHHYRDGRLSPGSVRPLSSPRIDSRPHGNHNDSEGLGSWDRERSRFSSPPYGWDASNRGRDYRERTWGRPDYRRPCPLPKLDSSKEWSQSDRELLEGRIDRYSSVSGREIGFADVASASNRDSTRNDWRTREKTVQSVFPTYSQGNNLYSRDSKNVFLASDAVGAVSPPQRSPLQSSFSHDSDLDVGPASKKRPRLTWGQGLAKYEKEKTGEEFSAAKKSAEGSNYVGGLHSDGSVASALPEFTLQMSNAVSCLEDVRHFHDQIRTSDSCLDGSIYLEQHQSFSRNSLANSSVKAPSYSTLEELHLDEITIINETRKSSSSEAAAPANLDSGGLVLQYMKAFINRYQQELPNLSKDILTQYVEKVEIEIDRLEKELVKLDNEPDFRLLLPELNAATAIVHSDLKSLEGALVLEPLTVPCKESPTCVECTCVTNGSLEEAGDKVGFCVLDVSGQEQDPPREADTAAQGMHQTDDQCIRDCDILAAPCDLPASELHENRKADAQSVEIKAEENWRESVASLLTSNQEIARDSAFPLAHLSAPGAGMKECVAELSGNLQDTSWWRQNVQRHEKNRELLESKIAEQKMSRRFTEGILAIRFRAKKEAWKQEQMSSASNREKDRHAGPWEFEQKGNSTPSRHSPLRLRPFEGLCVADATKEEVQVVEKLLEDCSFDIAREYVKMPPMTVGQKERAIHRFDTKNGLVEDPVAAEQERKATNPWSHEEKRIFLEKYSLLGKNLRKIASYLEHKSVADCVQFFYQNQKTEEFEKIHRRHQLKKRREARSSALYLATTTSVNSSYCEANDAYVEGLSLVAAAAAAMSVPRSARSLAMKSGASGSTNSRACRDSSMARQASTTFTLTAKNCNLEQGGSKTGPPYRSFKRPPEEVLQWKSQWDDRERELFMTAVALYGKDFDLISAHIGTKSVGQCKAYFSKARKRLGLDHLVEQQQEVSMNSRQQDDKLTNNAPSEFQAEVGVESQMGGDVPEQQLGLERSPGCANSCLAAEVHGDFLHEHRGFEPVAGISSPKSSQAVENIRSVIASQAAHQPIGDTLMNQGVYLTCFSSNANAESPSNSAVLRTAPSDAVQGCLNESLVCGVASQVKVEPSSLKLETYMASSSATGVSQSISSHGTPSPTPVSALMSHVGQSPQVKDKSVKTTEVKARREPTSWTQEEKEKFVDILKAHGKNWDLLCKSLPAKSLIQIKTYFQNSKAKLGLGSESAVNSSGRASSSWKRKVDDSDSSNNPGPGAQSLPQKAHVLSDEGNLKVNSSVLAAPGGPGGNVLSPEALAYANIFGRKLLEDSLNAQKVFHAMGLAPNLQSPGILPMLSSAVFTPPSLVSAQQSYLQTVSSASLKIPQGSSLQQPEQSLPSMIGVEPSSSAGVHQAHQLQPQQQVAVTCQDLPLSGVPAGCNKQSLQLDPLSLLQQSAPPNQQLQQVAEAVLQQLLPQAVQRHQQQLHLAGQQIPHHFQQVLSHHQAQPNWPAQSQVGSGAVPPASMVPSQQLQQQTGLMQSHLHHAHGKLHSLLQQHQQLPQLNQLQLLQLQRQQQQQQQHQQLLLHLQQAQALSQPHHIQNQALLMQQNHFSNEQQQAALLRGLTQASGEGFKQNDADFQTLTKSQQGAFNNAHQLLVPNQVNEVPQAVSEAQFPASDVKLFGQSLLSQPVSGNQHPTAAKFPSSPNPAGAAFVVPARPGNPASSTLRECVIQGQGWQQSTMASPHSNGGMRCNSIGGNEVVALNSQERMTSVERVNVDGADNCDGRAVDGKAISVLSCLPDGSPPSCAAGSLNKGVISSVPSFSCASSSVSFNQSDGQKSGQAVNLDTQCMKRKQESCSVLGSTVDVTASQGLPRVLDALVALAEWRLQNSSGCSGKLTDEFLSQSWEALQKNPGSLIEAGRAGGSLSQLYSEGPQMLQHLRERLLSSHSGFVHPHSIAAGAAGSDVESAGLSSNGQKLPSQASYACINEGGPACSDERVLMETDGSGGATG